METIKSYGIRAAAERLGIQPTALIRLLVSLGWISKGNHARATSLTASTPTACLAKHASQSRALPP